MQIALRPGRPEDFEFARDTYYETMRWIIERLFGWDQAGEDAKFAKYFDIDAVRVITVDGVDAGWLQTKTGEKSVVLSQFYVIPALQGKGIGSIVLKTLLNEVETQNKAITLGVVKFNPAVRLYERHGFKVTHEDEYKFYMTSRR